MKTPEEIKKGLETCAIGYEPCIGNCTYEDSHGSMPNCQYALIEDALTYIRQLEAREWDLFDLISSAWFGKRCYFRQDDGSVYSRSSGKYMSFDQAIDELAHELTRERECEQTGEDHFTTTALAVARRWIYPSSPEDKGT